MLFYSANGKISNLEQITSLDNVSNCNKQSEETHPSPQESKPKKGVKGVSANLHNAGSINCFNLQCSNKDKK